LYESPPFPEHTRRVGGEIPPSENALADWRTGESSINLIKVVMTFAQKHTRISQENTKMTTKLCFNGEVL
jgi:hypothetical protein